MSYLIATLPNGEQTKVGPFATDTDALNWWADDSRNLPAGTQIDGLAHDEKPLALA